MVRFATYNIQHGLASDGSTDPDRFATAVAALDADVLALQEVERDHPRSGHVDHTAIAARVLGAQAWRFAPTLRTAGGMWLSAAGSAWRRPALRRLPSYGIALVSRYPVDRWLRLDLPRRPAWECVVRRGEQLRFIPDEPRVALAAVVRAPDGPMTVVATHLTSLREATAAQLGALAQAWAPLPRPLVVLGDFNLDAPLPADMTGLRPLATALTHPVRRPVRQIDHILGDGVRALGPGVAVDTGLSDHRALVVDVEREPPTM